MKAFDDVAIPGTTPWVGAGSGGIMQGPVFPGGSAITQNGTAPQWPGSLGP